MMNASPVQLLSVAPWFDTEAALGLLEQQSDRRHAEQALAALRGSGLVVSSRGLERLSEPSRSRWREEFHARDDTLYGESIRVYLSFARGELGVKLGRVLGRDGGSLLVFALECVAGSVSSTTLGDAVDSLRIDGDRFDVPRSGATARLIRQYQFKRTRFSDFFEGIALWGSGERSDAARLFERVLEEPANDRITAISGHLLGVVSYGDGDLVRSRSLLKRSVEQLRELHDIPGLAVTLSSLGRALRAIAEQEGDRDALEESVCVLREALEVLPDESPLRGRASQYLAQSLADTQDFDGAIGYAEDAAALAATPMERVNALLVLALAHRAAGEQGLYIDTVELALQEAKDGFVDVMTLARASNMAAAAARREGDLPRAERLARKSLALGRQSGLLRHIPHAAHTLAAVLVDRLAAGEGDAEMAERALDLLEESKAALARRKDRAGMAKVDATRAHLNAILFGGQLD